MSEEVKEILEALKPHNDIIKEYPLKLSVEEQKLLLDYITNLQEQLKIKNEGFKATVEELCDTTKKYEDYKSRCEEAQYLISHELSHLKANDEITWNKEFYDENNKLDYRKLCIELLNQVINLLDGGNNE